MSVTETKELRGLCDANIVRALDAIALARGLDRNAYVCEVLAAHVDKYFVEHTLVASMMRGNPLLKESQGVLEAAHSAGAGK